MRNAIALAAAALLAGCSAASPAPRGWQAVPGTSGAWTTGSGSTHQEYYYTKTAFGGGLQDLASRITIDALMRNRGARLQGSLPFGPCPGAAGVATFRLYAGATMQVGFAVRNGQAIQIRYLRPTGTGVDPAAAAAMQTTLCSLQ